MTLTIELQDAVAEKAQRLARRKEKTISQLFENYVEELEKSERPTPIVDEILKLTEGFSLPADLDARKEYNEAMLRKHA